MGNGKENEKRKIDRVYEMFEMTGDRLWAVGFYKTALRFASSDEYVKYHLEQFSWCKGKKRMLKKIWNYVNDKAA
jgi:hypothetical protein